MAIRAKKKKDQEGRGWFLSENLMLSLLLQRNTICTPKQFGRYVEANQHLFDIPTRKKAILANKFQGFKETKEWDEFFGDLELVEMDLKKNIQIKER